MSASATVITAAGQRYAVDCGPEKALRMSLQHDLVKLTAGNETIWLKSSSITSAAVMPIRQQPVFTMTPPPKRRGDA